MTQSSRENHGGNRLTPIAFGLLASGVGVMLVKKLFEKGREQVAQGAEGVVYSDPEERTIAVRRDSVAFQDGPFGEVLSLPRTVAEEIVADLETAAATEPLADQG